MISICFEINSQFDPIPFVFDSFHPILIIIIQSLVNNPNSDNFDLCYPYSFIPYYLIRLLIVFRFFMMYHLSKILKSIFF